MCHERDRAKWSLRIGGVQDVVKVILHPDGLALAHAAADHLPGSYYKRYLVWSILQESLQTFLEQDDPSLESRPACVASSSVDNAKYKLPPNPHLSQNPASAVTLILQPCHQDGWAWNILRRAAEPVLWKCLLGNDDTDIFFLQPDERSIAEPAAEASHRITPAVWDLNRTIISEVVRMLRYF